MEIVVDSAARFGRIFLAGATTVFAGGKGGEQQVSDATPTSASPDDIMAVVGARALIKAMVLPTGLGTRHILTVASPTEVMSTAIELDEKRRLHVEHATVVRSLGALLASGTSIGLVLRTFSHEIAFVLPNGVDIPVKTIRCWFIADGQVRPASEAETFSACCTDARTGEPIPPERGTEYADAWPMTLD